VPNQCGPEELPAHIRWSDMVDLAEMVGANLGIMESDAHRMRGDGPVFLVSVRSGSGMEAARHWVLNWVHSARAKRH
jgi:urease accessory protein